MMKTMMAGTAQRTWLDEVQADSPIRLWLMQETSGTTMNAVVGTNGTYTASGVTYGVTGPLKAALPVAAQFNGITGAASAAVDLTTLAPQRVTICWWMYWDAYANNDKLAFEFTTNAAANSGFYINPNSGIPAVGRFAINVGRSSPGRYYLKSFARPSESAWHHLAVTIDRETQSTSLYIDGVSQSVNTSVSTGLTDNDFANSTLYFMSRATTALNGAGRMAGVSLHSGILSASRIAAHYAGA